MLSLVSVAHQPDTDWVINAQPIPEAGDGFRVKELAAACPGAARVIGVRKTCVGYFLAE